LRGIIIENIHFAKGLPAPMVIKSGKLEGIEMPIDKGFSDIELFTRL